MKRILPLFCILACLLSACAPKKAITADEFTFLMQTEGFEVVGSGGTVDEAIENILVAEKDYEISFCEIASVELAETFYHTTRNLLSEEHSVKTMALSTSSTNSNYYSFTADGNFYLISQIDDTVLYCEAPKEYKKEIIELVKTLGYR